MFIKTKILPPGFSAITLWPFVLIHPDEAENEIMRQHEAIHLKQQAEMLVIPFYLWYLIEWLVKLIIYRDWMWAYLSISFEREANNWERWPGYVKTRKHFYWIKYL